MGSSICPPTCLEKDTTSNETLNPYKLTNNDLLVYLSKHSSQSVSSILSKIVKLQSTLRGCSMRRKYKRLSLSLNKKSTILERCKFNQMTKQISFNTDWENHFKSSNVDFTIESLESLKNEIVVFYRDFFDPVVEKIVLLSEDEKNNELNILNDRTLISFDREINMKSSILNKNLSITNHELNEAESLKSLSKDAFRARYLHYLVKRLKVGFYLGSLHSKVSLDEEIHVKRSSLTMEYPEFILSNNLYKYHSKSIQNQKLSLENFKGQRSFQAETNPLKCRTNKSRHFDESNQKEQESNIESSTGRMNSAHKNLKNSMKANENEYTRKNSSNVVTTARKLQNKDTFASKLSNIRQDEEESSFVDIVKNLAASICLIRDGKLKEHSFEDLDSANDSLVETHLSRSKYGIVPELENILNDMAVQKPYTKPVSYLDDDTSIFYEGGFHSIRETKYGLGFVYMTDLAKSPKRYKYIGYFKDDLYHGLGIMVREGGYYYKGEFREGKYNGYGVEHSRESFSYEGFFLNGVFHGYGKFYNIVKGTSYIGNFIYGRKDGLGLYETAQGCKYLGFWKKGSMNGLGLFSWKEGHRYFGQWKNDKMNGKGKFVWKKGDYYIGNYSNDFRHGDGEYYFTDGSILKGRWVYGKKEGTFVLIQDQEIESVQYRNDIQI